MVMVPSPKQFKKTKVTEWIKNLRIAFPYSLNDKIGEEYQVHTTDIIGLKFMSLLRPHLHVRGTSKY